MVHMVLVRDHGRLFNVRPTVPLSLYEVAGPRTLLRLQRDPAFRAAMPWQWSSKRERRA